MGKPKPIEYHIGLIKELHSKLLEYPDSETIKEQLYRQISQWEHKIKKIYFNSGQEQYPWTEDKLGHEVRKMMTQDEMKKEFKTGDMLKGFKWEDIQPQCGDYQCFCPGIGWIPIVIERKGGKEGESGPHDLYGSLADMGNRKNLHEEIDRMNKDKRFFYRYLLAECSYGDFMNYIPDYNRKDTIASQRGLSQETRSATIASLEIRGIHVMWEDTRDRAIQKYIDLNRQYLMRNYTKILGLQES